MGQTLRALGRLDEAADFLRMAAYLLRDPPAPWHLARSLVHLADACADNRQPDQAFRYRTEALDLLAPFTDPEATTMRSRLQALTAR